MLIFPKDKLKEMFCVQVWVEARDYQAQKSGKDEFSKKRSSG